MGAFREWAPQSESRRAPSRYALAGALIGALIVTAAAALALGVGDGATRGGSGGSSARRIVAADGNGATHHGSSTLGAGNAASPSQRTSGAATRAAGGGSSAAHGHSVSPASQSAATGAAAHGAAATEARDPLEASSYPAPAGVRHAAAHAPRRAASEAIVAPGAASDAEIRAELARMRRLERQASATATIATVPGGDSIAGSGKIPIPQDVPEVVQRVIAGANAIADFPYVYGGGHASFVDTAYDCSGSVSYALAAGGLLKAPETSGQLESWGVPGQGKWITVYANAGHTYMYVNVGGRWMLYDTAGRSGVYASRWQPSPVNNEGYVVRHWPGL